MNLKETIKLIYRKKWLIFWVTVLGAVLFFDLMVVQAPNYKASSKILVVQKQVAGQDIYTISKSAQYITRILKEGIYSDSFFDKIINSGYEIDENDFPSYAKERRKQWEKDIEVRIVRDLGVMEIDVFHAKQKTAENISLAITNILEKNHQFYHGAGENIEVKVLDNPLVSKKPVISNLFIVSILGAIIGFLIGISWVLARNKKDIVRNIDPYQEYVYSEKEASSLKRSDISF